ncbi:MAG: hypothetical protein JOY80_04340 [Candidatus Dormibacteraeota bacterium]|nr:hypothetical protein [Candidatus Dormibacteraeota bacterium]
MSDTPRRPLTRLERAAFYGALGWATEVAFSGVQGVLRSDRDWRLRGHSYLWMLPIYGLAAFLFEPAHDLARRRSVWQRAALYAAGFSAVEYATGMAIRRMVGVVPWDYTGHGRFVVPGGAVRLDFMPVWAVAGLALERIHDAIRDLPVRPARSSTS